MNLVTRILALGVLGAASLTQGCGCSSNNNSTTTTEPPPVETPTVAISGIAVKGVVGLANITAHTLDSVGRFSPTPISSALTDALGKYTIKIPETYIGKPLSFRITPAASTLITCDLDIGCGNGTNDVPFGQKYSLPSDSGLVLETIVPALDKTKSVNISTFTTLAAEQARKALASNNDLAALTAAIKKANGEIANMFSLVGELSELELIDITDANAVKTAVNGGKSGVLRLAALNAAIISASQSANPGSTLEQALAKLIADITGKGIASNSSNSKEADLTKILTALSNILERVKQLNAEGVNLNDLITSVANDLGRVRNEPVDVYNPGTTLPDDVLPVKAKAFAELVRDLINGGDILLDTKVGNSTIKASSNKLRAQWDAAQMLSGPDVEALGKSLSVAAEAVAEAADAYHYDAKLETYTAGDVNVVINNKKVDSAVVYTVDQVISGNTVKLAATSQHTDTKEGAVETATGKLQLSGSATNAAVKISVGDASSLEAVKLTRETKNNVETTVLEGLKLTLTSEVAQLEVGNVTDPVSASGTLKFEFANFERVKGASGAEPVTKGAMAISFDGKVKNKASEAFAFALNIAGDSKGITIDELSQGIDPTDISITENDFNSLTAAVSFTADLNTQMNVARVKLMTTRESLSATRTSLDLIFGAYNLRFATLIERVADQPYNLFISNQDRLTMTLNQTTAGGDVTGNITGPGGAQVLADIVQTNLGIKVTIKGTGDIVFLNNAP